MIVAEDTGNKEATGFHAVGCGLARDAKDAVAVQATTVTGSYPLARWCYPWDQASEKGHCWTQGLDESTVTEHVLLGN